MSQRLKLDWLELELARLGLKIASELHMGWCEIYIGECTESPYRKINNELFIDKLSYMETILEDRSTNNCRPIVRD